MVLARNVGIKIGIAENFVVFHRKRRVVDIYRFAVRIAEFKQIKRFDRVLTFANDEWSIASAVVTATPKASVIPQNVKATAGDKKITLTWSAVENAAQYRVQRLVGSTWTTVATPTATSCTNGGLTNGETYSYRVLALVDGKWNGASAVVKATPKA